MSTDTRQVAERIADRFFWKSDDGFKMLADVIDKALSDERERGREARTALKEAAFSYHVEAEHKSAFATCRNIHCATACRLWNAATTKE